MQITEIRIEAGEALDLISIQISQILSSSKFETFTFTADSQTAGSCSFWDVLSCDVNYSFYSMFVYDKNKDTHFWHRVYYAPVI